MISKIRTERVQILLPQTHSSVVDSGPPRKLQAVHPQERTPSDLLLSKDRGDTGCYLPGVGFLSFNDEREQYLFTAVLRPGNAPAKAGVIGILWRLLGRVRKAFPKVRIRVRLDGGFADPLVLEFLDTMGVEYVVAMAQNAVLSRIAEPAMKQARKLSEASGQTEYVYGETRYAAESWPAARRVIFKAEVVRQEGKEPKDNPRFAITNLKQNPQWIYERVYCARARV